LADRCLDTGAMDVRTRGLDIKAGAAKLKADRAARAEAEAVIQRWNDQLSRGRDMLWSPTIRAGLFDGRATSAPLVLAGAVIWRHSAWKNCTPIDSAIKEIHA
jgi:hypothetical protein